MIRVAQSPNTSSKMADTKWWVSPETPSLRVPKVNSWSCVASEPILILQPAMSALGVKMVKGDLEDVESYTPALEGLYGAFVNADCELQEL